MVMKKLITILAALMVSAVAHAVVIDWVVTPIYPYVDQYTEVNTGGSDGYIGFLLDDLVYSQVQASKDVIYGDLSFVNTSLASDDVSLGVLEKRGLNVPDDTSDYLYIAVFNASTIEDATAVYITDLERYPVDFVRVHHKKTIDSKYGWNWLEIGSAIPEPTSGVLLLLGIAALALKRRQ